MIDDIVPQRASPPEPEPEPRPERPPPSVSPWWRRFGIFVLVLLGLSLLPPLTVLAMRWIPPPTTAFMLRSEVQPVQYEWVPAARIPEVLRRAVVASEDQKFHVHNGFDLEAIEAALEQNRRGGRVRGASTITQQVAKNLFLWPGRSWVRKGVEVTFTILIELCWSKDRILEVYLNIAEFGPGIYGVEAASAAFFHKPAARLTPNEAARLVAVLPSPRKWKAQPPGPYVQRRANWILAQIGERPRASAPAEEPLPPGGMPPESAEPDEPDEQPADIFRPPDEDEAWTPPEDDEPADLPTLEEPMPPAADEPAEEIPAEPEPEPAAEPPPEEEPAAPVPGGRPH